ncbi:MAG: hypothetical protein ACJ76N_15625, partial [Thermoanaerobaculia bacterium]
VFFLGLAGLAALAMPRLRPRLLGVLRRNLLSVMVGAAAAGLAMAPLVVHSLAVVRAMGWAGDASTPFLPRLESWLYPGRRAPLYFWLGRMPFFQGIPGEPEQRLFVGAVTLVCAGLGVWSWRESPWMRLLAVLTVSLVVLTTELPGGFSLWHAVRAAVPGARALRIVSRVGVLLAFPAGVGLAAFFSRPRRTVATALLLGLCLADQAYSEYTFSKIRTREVVAAYAAAVPPGCRNAYLAVRTAPGADRPHWVFQEEIQLSELARGVPLVNGGYTRFYPPGYGMLGRNVFSSPEERALIRRDFDAWLTLYGLSPRDVCWIEVPDPHQRLR